MILSFWGKKLAGNVATITWWNSNYFAQLWVLIFNWQCVCVFEFIRYFPVMWIAKRNICIFLIYQGSTLLIHHSIFTILVTVYKLCYILIQSAILHKKLYYTGFMWFVWSVRQNNRKLIEFLCWISQL